MPKFDKKTMIPNKIKLKINPKIAFTIINKDFLFGEWYFPDGLLMTLNENYIWAICQYG